MGCEMVRVRWISSLTPKRVGAGLAGVTLIALAWRLSPASRGPVTTAVLAAGFVLVAVFSGMPVVTAAWTDHPLISIFGTLLDQEQALCLRIRRLHERALYEVASNIVLDKARAIEVAELAIERVASRWRGPVDDRLEHLLLCQVVHIGVNDGYADPVLEPGDVRTELQTHSRPDRAVRVLRKLSVPDELIAQILGTEKLPTDEDEDKDEDR